MTKTLTVQIMRSKANLYQVLMFEAAKTTWGPPLGQWGYSAAHFCRLASERTNRFKKHYENFQQWKMKEWHLLTGLQSCLGPAVILGLSQMTKMQRSERFKLQQQIIWLTALDNLKTANSPFPPCPSTTKLGAGAGHKIGKDKRQKSTFAGLGHQREKVPALRRDFFNIKKWEKGWRTSRDFQFYPHCTLVNGSGL